MKKVTKKSTILNLTRFVVATLCVSNSAQSMATEKSIDFSGFSRIVAGVLDDKNASYDGYDNSLSFGQQSLLAIQVDAHLTDKWSVTTQLLAHSSEERESGVEWLYTTYQPTDALQLKLGKLRTPFFNNSDFQDVGYAYPWISLPKQVYKSFLFDSYEGASASYEIVEGGLSLNAEVFWGRFEDTIFVGDSKADASVEDFRGVILKAQYSKLDIRASSHKGNVEIDLPEIRGFADTLLQIGYADMARQFGTAGVVTANQLSVNYDTLDYFLKSEIVQIKSPIAVVPQTNSYYLTAGYVFYPFTVHATFASSDVRYTKVQSVIPSGLAPQLDALSTGLDILYESLPRDNLDSLSLGLRWDFTAGMALKAEITHLRGETNKRSFFKINNPETFDHRANLLQVSWEWVF